jgi:hypothetical protein
MGKLLVLKKLYYTITPLHLLAYLRGCVYTVQARLRGIGLRQFEWEFGEWEF